MSTWLLDHAGIVRFILVGSVLAVLLLVQRLLPLRGEVSAPGRRLRNIGMSVIAAAIVYLVLPLTAVGFSAAVGDLRLGLFNHLDWPHPVEFAITIVILDLAIYWQHRWMHLVPWLWRLHRVHHSDTQFEVTLGLRFHPGEIVLSLLYKLLVIAMLGAAPLTVLAYEVLLAIFSLFSHADIRLPHALERRLRLIFITPDWHRVHHSVHREETDSNYGNLLSVWDRCFASGIEQPRDGHRPMQIGLHAFRDDASQSLSGLLKNPFAKDRDHTRP